MSLSELLALIALLLVVAYWLNAMQAKELARREGRRRCQTLDLVFLDDTVVLKKLRLVRNTLGQLVLRREYQFEFSSDGSRRYRGDITLLSKRLEGISMEAYRSPEQPLHSPLE